MLRIVEDDGESVVVKRGGFSTMASYLPKKRRRKNMGSSFVEVNWSCHLQASC